MAETQKVWTQEEISRYLNASGFTELFEVQTAFAQIKTAELLCPFLESVEGRLLCSSIMKGIASNMRRIISLSIDGFDKNYDDIRQASLEINVAHEFMMGIVKVLDTAKRLQESQEEPAKVD